MFDCLYETKEIKEVLGYNFCGPDKLPHFQEVRIAVFEEDHENDGYGVELYCTAAPAKFFTVKALDYRNSVGDEKKGFSLSTGSGQFEWAVNAAKMINEGMLSCDT